MATNNNRNPEQLKQIVDSSNQDLEQMKLGLEKLRHLSKDDRTEAAMLRSRIDDQSQLIMMLKNRSDENLRRVQVLERMKKDLELCGQNANNELRLETKKAEMLERRFSELASNHEEMIKIKDEYKGANVLLKRENERLLRENENLFSHALSERDVHIQELEDKRQSLQKQCTSLEQKYRTLASESELRERELKQRLSTTEVQTNSQRESLARQLSLTEQKLKDALSRLEEERNQQSNTDVRYKELTKEKDQLLELAMHRGKLIQEKQVDNKNLSRNIDDLKSTVRTLEERFTKEASLVDTSRAVGRLRDELDKTERRYKEVISEYNAYKSHSKHLLDQERKLNEKLRHLAA